MVGSLNKVSLIGNLGKEPLLTDESIGKAFETDYRVKYNIVGRVIIEDKQYFLGIKNGSVCHFFTENGQPYEFCDKWERLDECNFKLKNEVK